jgi:phenylalanyl-tRNA synthetase alpha chain
LFQPQTHSARTYTDSYYLKNPSKGKLPDRKIVEAVKAAHEYGGVSDSRGWRYDWSESIAQRMVPAMHGTAHSAKQLVKGVKIPNKYFAIARCFRPDVLDATHLIEFNQMEGFIVGNDLNFKHLLGMLKDFAIEVAGAEKVKFFPDYYPFTEPSVQLSAKHPEMGWVEFAGAGMFRPEMLKNLGIEGEAIAWGMGIDRLAMFKLGIKDIRYLFSDDLNYLRNAKGVLL